MRLLLGSIDNGHVRHVGPLFVGGQTTVVELVVQVAKRWARNPRAENGGRNRNECFHFSQRYFEGLNLAADSLQVFPGFLFGSIQTDEAEGR